MSRPVHRPRYRPWLAAALATFGWLSIVQAKVPEGDSLATMVAGGALAFEPNQGQADSRVRFLTRAAGYTLFLTDDEAVWRISSEDEADQVLRMRLVGGRAQGAQGDQAQIRQHHYFDIRSGAARAAEVPTYAAARFSAVWPGVDLVYYGRDGELEYDFELAPGVDPAVIALRFEGGTPHVADDGSLHLRGGAQDLRMKPPVSYQTIDGKRRLIESRYALRDGTIGFALGEYDRNRPLVIDPIFVYASYLGGSAEDRAYAVAVNAAGEAYVTGYTASTNFPLVNALDPSYAGNTDAYVTKFSADGSSVLFSTYLGGPHHDEGDAIALDPDGNIYITGRTTSANGDWETYELKLNATASQLIYSNITTASGYDAGYGIAADADGNAYVVGFTDSPDFPLQNAIQPTYAGGDKGFLRKVGPTGETLTSTYLGGTAASTYAHAVALDGVGNIYMAGSTRQNDPASNAFLLKLGNDGRTLGFSRQFGGSGSDYGFGLAVTTAGVAYVSGYTYSDDLPSATGFDTSFGGDSDGYIARYDAAGNLLNSTYFGGPDSDDLLGLALESDGRVVAIGSTDNNGFRSSSTTLRISASLDQLQGQARYASGWASGEDVAVDGAGHAYAVTRSADALPTTPGAFQTARPGDQNGHLAKIAWSHPSVTVNDRTRTEGNTGTTSVDVFVSVGSNNAGVVEVNYATANGTATAGSDYVAASGTAVIPSGTFSVPVPLAILGDAIDEPNETFTLNLSSPVNAIIADAPAVITITDDDQPNGQFNMSACSGSEGGGEVVVTVNRQNGSYGPVSVAYSTSTNTAGTADFTNTSGTLSWPDGDADPRSFAVSVNNDTLDEPNELFNVGLGSPNGGATIVAPAVRSCTIVDDDPAPSISINDRSVTEGTGGSVSVTFTVSLSAASGRTVSVDWATANGSATAPADYAAGSGTLNFTSGQTSRTITRSIVTDALDEPNETFFVNLSNAANASIADAQGRATINDDDAAPTLAVDNGGCTVTEGNSGSVNCTFVFRLSALSGRAVTFDTATANGSATGGSDYTGHASTARSIAAGQTTLNVSVPVLGDTLDEANETFTLQASSIANATPSSLTASGMINDNDAAPNVSVDDCAVVEGSSSIVNCRFRVRLSAASGRTVNVNWAVARAAENVLGNGDFETPAIAGDFVTYAPPQTFGGWGVASGAVDLVRQLWTPASGNQSLELNGAGPGTVAALFQNPGPSRLSFAYTGNPGCGPGIKSFGIFTASTEPLILDVDVAGLDYANMGWQWVELPGSSVTGDEALYIGGNNDGPCGAVVDDIAVVPADIASPPVDLAWSTGTATIAAGATQSALIDIPIRGDTLEEIDEHFAIVVTGGSNFGSSTPGIGTILTDDAPAGIFCSGFEDVACVR